MIVDDKLMKYVLFKKRTRQEVKEKCHLLNYEEDYTEEVLNYLEENDYINDEVYTQKYIASVKRLKTVSRNEIKQDLLRRGVSEAIIEKYFDEDLQEFELQSAIKLIQKKARTMEVPKIKRFLQNKGYSYDIIRKAIDNCLEIEDNEE